MTQMFLERTFPRPLTVEDVLSQARDADWCFEMYNVSWHGSLLSADGRRMLCRFSAADAESVRQALRESRSDTTHLWIGTIHEASEPVAANVVVERSFESPVELEVVQETETANIACLEVRNVRFARTFFSTDRKRMICLYSAPDAESVREAQREAGLPMDGAWTFEVVDPELTA
jgi:hypothetical protein